MLSIIQITQILREINFGQSKAEFGHFIVSELCECGRFHTSKSAKIHENQNSEPLDMLTAGGFRDSRIANFDFT